MPFLLLLKAIFAPAKIMGFLTNAAGFVVKYWRQIAVIGMVVAIFHQNFMEWEALKWVGVRTIPGIEQEYKEEINVLTEQLATCEASRTELKQQIESVNSQIDQWANVSGQLQQQHDALVQELTDMKKQSQQAVQDILAGPTPETCEAAIQFLKEAAQGDLKWQE